MSRTSAVLCVLVLLVAGLAHGFVGEVTLELGYDDKCGSQDGGLAMGPIPFEAPSALALVHSGPVEFNNVTYATLSVSLAADSGRYELKAGSKTLQDFSDLFACQKANWDEPSAVLVVGGRVVQSVAIVAGEDTARSESEREWALLIISAIAGATVMMCGAKILTHLQEQKRAQDVGYEALK